MTLSRRLDRRGPQRWSGNLGVTACVRIIPVGRSLATTIAPVVALNLVR
ncbi:MAG TPA: hypothetical protein VMH39_00595 [Gemmatimonadaceae bacterium]|nr:hypothetical protein [Gemmatimonadaceae bacterium]